VKKNLKFIPAGLLMMCISNICSQAFSDSGSISRVMSSLKSGNEVTITALGGSITTGYAAHPPLQKGWAALVNEWWQEKALETGGKVTYYNAGVSGTDSAFAAARLEDHILSKKPDLVFLEFAMNDQWLDRKVRQRSYEGILRTMLNNGSAVFALFVNEKLPPYRSNQDEQMKICEHYAVPYVSWKDSVNSFNDEAVWNAYFSGSETIHPNDQGHASIASLIIEQLDTIWNSGAEDAAFSKPSSLPEPLTLADFENVRVLYNSNTVPLSNTGWEEGSPVHDDWRRIGSVKQGWSTVHSDAVISFNISAISCGIMYAESTMFRNAEAWIEWPDGTTGRKVSLNCYNASRNGYLGWYYAEIFGGTELKTGILHIGVKKSRSTDEGKSVNIAGIIVTGAE